MHKTYVFRTPSNQKIEVDSKIYSFFRDIITVEDLKFLFTSKERLYSMDLFELAFFNKATFFLLKKKKKKKRTTIIKGHG